MHMMFMQISSLFLFSSSPVDDLRPFAFICG